MSSGKKQNNGTCVYLELAGQLLGVLMQVRPQWRQEAEELSLCHKQTPPDVHGRLPESASVRAATALLRHQSVLPVKALLF